MVPGLVTQVKGSGVPGGGGVGVGTSSVKDDGEASESGSVSVLPRVVRDVRCDRR